MFLVDSSELVGDSRLCIAPFVLYGKRGQVPVYGDSPVAVVERILKLGSYDES